MLISGATEELVRDHVTADALGPLPLHNRRGRVEGWLLRACRTPDDP